MKVTRGGKFPRRLLDELGKEARSHGISKSEMMDTILYETYGPKSHKEVAAALLEEMAD